MPWPYQSYVFSGDPNSYATEFNALQFVGNTGIAADLGLESHSIGFLGFVHRSVLMGPFYTGKIVLNNITPVGDPTLGYVNPAGTSMPDTFVPTTTLPLVWFSSWTKFSNTEGTSVETALIKDDSGANYPDPWPLAKMVVGFRSLTLLFLACGRWRRV